ncbi:hypothetical protein [Massilia sp. DWR3-1-1]|uniref:hypothetical protein n=1 Tax=Massilia sp. DWR3-1-1 TaxID=2804559 RepID=UPI003CE7D0A6
MRLAARLSLSALLVLFGHAALAQALPRSGEMPPDSARSSPAQPDKARPPATGSTPEQLAMANRRARLSSPAQAQCRQLDKALALALARERDASREQLKQAQASLFELRKQFSLIGC